MKTLFRSTGTQPAAKRISTGMGVVKPTRRVASVPADEEEVDEDNGDHQRPADEERHVPVDDRIVGNSSARVPEDDDRRPDREDEEDGGGEQYAGIGGHFRDALAGEKFENLLHGGPLSDDARLTMVR